MIRIGPLQVDVDRREILLDGAPVRLGSRAFDLLVVLAAARGGLVSKDDLLRQVWPNSIVEENNLQVHMSALRKILGDSRGLIQTVPGRGYRLMQGRIANPGTSSRTGRNTTQSVADPDLAFADDPSGEFTPSRGIPNNLPAQLSTLIGRDEAIRDLSTTLANGRHVTLVGSGGIGKTRLAIEVARSLMASFPDGVYLVALASTSDANSVLAAFAASIGVSQAIGPLTFSRVSKSLSERRVLFVLDNCEHVLEPVAELAETLLALGPAVRVLATSREPLRVVTENLYWVPSLQVPGQDDENLHVLQCSAVELFLSRARAIDARFPSDETTVRLTGTVCRRLDGIPLAIELAAARAAILGIETLVAHLDDRFNVLTGGNRTALPRHQTLKATLDWSHALLDDAERTSLRRLGIFVNGFTMEAAIAVAGDSTLSELDVITAVSGLVEKSLLVTRTERGRASYRLLETTRAYALQKLDDNGERRFITLHHARYYLSVLEGDKPRRGEASATQADGWHRRMLALLDDLRSALGWALSPKGDEALGESLAVNVVFLLYELSLVDECCIWARRALDVVAVTHRSSGSSRHLLVRMQLQSALAAGLVYVHGPNRETFGIWSEVLAAAIAADDPAFEARALWGMWNASQSAGAARNALAFARRFASLAVETGDTSGTILGYRLIGIASHYSGDQRQARASLERLLQHADELKHGLPLGQSVDQRVVGQATLARVLWLQGWRDQALALAEDSVNDACEQQQAIVTCYVLVEALVPLMLLAGKREGAAEAIALLREVSARGGLSVAQACCRCFEEYLHTLDEERPLRPRVFRAALDELEALEFGAPRAMLVGRYGLLLGRAGRYDEGIATLTAALQQCDETGDGWYAVELKRIHGDLLAMKARESSGRDAAASEKASLDAQACLRAALQDSYEQECRSFQLRAATSLASLWHARGESAEAVRLLESACAEITEGRDCDDYLAAVTCLRVAKQAGGSGAASEESGIVAAWPEQEARDPMAG
ncbi:ATP-binding protein [Paraburkholderia sp. BCC1886]|uniref:ATP-binding protein n=1 Tax=Paraburkholderia sp. BCC1886 TaxID=2562670 RepID=UPI0011845FB8|nr:winged helix-turn-helix domain-containing protein [Paraburkholderia sp. BCC1886]